MKKPRFPLDPDNLPYAPPKAETSHQLPHDGEEVLEAVATRRRQDRAGIGLTGLAAVFWWAPLRLFFPNGGTTLDDARRNLWMSGAILSVLLALVALAFPGRNWLRFGVVVLGLSLAFGVLTLQRIREFEELVRSVSAETADEPPR